MRIAVIGAGPSGIAAALEALKSSTNASVVVYSRENCLPYDKTRLLDVAFSKVAPESIILHNEKWYAEQGISLRINTPVLDLYITEERIMIKTPDGESPYDFVIFASGSSPIIPVIPGLIASQATYTIWTLADAKRLASITKRIRTIAIIGGGSIGIEAALKARDAKLKVHLFEKEKHVLPNFFDDPVAEIIENTITENRIELHKETTIQSAIQIGSKVSLTLSDKSKLDVDAVLYTCGVRPITSIAQNLGVPCGTGISVNKEMRTNCPFAFAGGDCIQYGTIQNASIMSAVTTGRIAGKNAVVSASIKLDGEEYSTIPHIFETSIPLSHKSDKLEYHSWGRTAKSSIDAKLKTITNKNDEGGYKAQVVRSDGQIIGLQMIGNGKEFEKQLEKILQSNEKTESTQEPPPPQTPVAKRTTKKKAPPKEQ